MGPPPTAASLAPPPPRRRADGTALEERLQYAIGEQERVSAIAEARRQEAESARKWTVWLGSPLYPANLARWAGERGPRVLAVLVLAALLVLLLRISLRRVARAVVTQSRKARSSAVNRADTLALSLESVGTTLILVACVLLVLQEAGLDVKTVLGGAAILGVAVAFGAQNLMRDYFTGLRRGGHRARLPPARGARPAPHRGLTQSQGTVNATVPLWR